MSYWHEKVAVVTGGSSGLGYTLAHRLANAGARVIIAARDPARLEAASRELANAGNVVPKAVDITSDEQVQRFFDEILSEFGRLDTLVNCAGRSDRGRLAETPTSRLCELWQLNFLGAVRCAQQAASALVASRGHLVFIGSLAAKSAPRYLGAYPSSKFPLVAAAQQFRLELGPDGLHVLLVCPGPIARPDGGRRYDEIASNLPEAARQPGGGVKLRGIHPERLAEQILRACERRKAELVVPAKARWLFALAQIAPEWADRILLRKTGA